MFCMQMHQGFPFYLFGEFQEMPVFTDMNAHDLAVNALLFLPKKIAFSHFPFWLLLCWMECASQEPGGSYNLEALFQHSEPLALVWQSPAFLLGEIRLMESRR